MPPCTISPNLCGTPAATAAMKCATACYPVCSTLPGVELTSLIVNRGQLTIPPPGFDAFSAANTPQLIQIQKVQWAQFVHHDGICREPHAGRPESAKSWHLFKKPLPVPPPSASEASPAASALIPAITGIDRELQARSKSWWNSLAPQYQVGLTLCSGLLVLLGAVEVGRRVFRRRQPTRNGAGREPAPHLQRQRTADPSQQGPAARSRPAPGFGAAPSASSLAPRGMMDSQGDIGTRDTIPPVAPMPQNATATIEKPADPKLLEASRPSATPAVESPRLSRSPAVFYISDDEHILSAESTPIPMPSSPVPDRAVLDAIDSFSTDGSTIDLTHYERQGVAVTPATLKSAALIVHRFLATSDRRVTVDLRALMDHLVKDLSGGISHGVSRTLMVGDVVAAVERQRRAPIDRKELDALFSEQAAWLATPTVRDRDEEIASLSRRPSLVQLEAARAAVKAFLDNDPVFGTREDKAEIAEKFVIACDEIRDFSRTYFRDGRVTRAGVEFAMKHLRNSVAISAVEPQRNGGTKA